MFYPDVQTVLMRNVDELLEQAEGRAIPGTIRGLISPHAGYIYSGLTAAHAYRLLKGSSVDTVIVVGPSHREYFDGISVYPGDAYRTPLGDVQVDADVRSDIVRIGKGIVISFAGHRSEHSVEVQLPFLQRVLSKFTFVPIVMGDQRREFCEHLSEVLATVASSRNAVLIASSDLSHYHRYNEALALDKQVVRDVELLKPNDLLAKLEQEEVEACGGGPMVSVMLAAQKLGANKSHVLYYCNSGDVTGEKDAVVGYLSAALTKVN